MHRMLYFLFVVLMASVDILGNVVFIRDAEKQDKKLSYCWETVRRESMPRIAEMDVEMTT